MNNRQRILHTSLKLFNQKGVAAVSVRDISRELDISPGNFSYHFPDKSQLVVQLYQDMMHEIYKIAETLSQQPPSIVNWLETHKQIFMIQHRYKFFFLNLFAIVTQHPDIAKIFRESYLKEREFAIKAIRHYQQAGILIKNISEEQAQSVVAVGQVLNNSWMIDAQIHYKGDYQEMMKFYMQLCCGRLLPYLTPTSKKQYQQYFQQLEIPTSSL